MEKRLILIGTSHISRKSVEEVLETIEKEKPDAVAVELCPRRFHALFSEPKISLKDALKEPSLFIFQVILAYMQQKVGKEVGVKPGSEIFAAIEKARELGVDILLIDRDIGITFSRLWRSLSFFEKIKLFIYFFKKDDLEVSDLTEVDLLVDQFRKISPKAAKVLVDERDAYMAYCLREALKKYKKVVAIVGAGHKKGIEEKIEKEVDIKELLEVKKGTNLFKVFTFLMSLFIIIFLILVAYLSKEVAFEVFKAWFLINGLFAASGALIARAHPLSTLTAFSTAWLTSLNPFVAAGWLAGIVEAWRRKITIGDVLKIKEAKDFSDLMKNKFFRVLLVAALTNVGSFLGTIFGSYYILTNYNVNVHEAFKNILNFINFI